MIDGEPVMDDAELAEFALSHFAILHRKLMALADVKQRELILRAAAETLWDQVLSEMETTTPERVNSAEDRLWALFQPAVDEERAKMQARN